MVPIKSWTAYGTFVIEFSLVVQSYIYSYGFPSWQPIHVLNTLSLKLNASTNPIAYGLILFNNSIFYSLNYLYYSTVIRPDSINVFGLSNIIYTAYKSHKLYNISLTVELEFYTYSVNTKYVKYSAYLYATLNKCVPTS